MKLVNRTIKKSNEFKTLNISRTKPHEEDMPFQLSLFGEYAKYTARVHSQSIKRDLQAKKSISSKDGGLDAKS